MLVAYSIPSSQNSAIILLSSLAFGFKLFIGFCFFFTGTDFSMTVSFEMGLFGFFSLWPCKNHLCLHSLKYNYFQVPLPEVNVD